MIMADFRKKIFFALNCAASSPETEHLCENPLGLSCGHFICKDCIQTGTPYSIIKCNLCGKMNKNDLKQEDEPHAFKLLFEQNINELFDNTLEKFKKTFEMCSDMIINNKQRIDNHVEFIKETVLLRVESLKTELDKLYDTFSIELDEIGEKWKVMDDKNKPDYDQTLLKFQEELCKLEEKMNERNNLNQEDLYHCQKQIKQIQQVIKEYKENSPSLEFKQSEASISKLSIGEFVYNDNWIDDSVDIMILERIKANVFEQIKMQYQAEDSCKLSNGNLLLSDYVNSNLQLCDANMKPIRTITSINGLSYKIAGITIDESNDIYMCATEKHSVIKTDANFHQLAIFGCGHPGSTQNQLNLPNGICYYKQSVYVCDYQNERIQKFSKDLVFEASYPLNFNPYYIKNIKNVAIVKGPAIYFYDLDTFHLLKKHDGHNGVIGASNNYFYEYYANNKKFYCYKKNGEIVDQIQINGWEFSNNYGSICLMDGKLVLTNHINNYIVVI